MARLRDQRRRRRRRGLADRPEKYMKMTDASAEEGEPED